MSRILQRAIKERYLIIDQKRNTVTYLPQENPRPLNTPEERVQLKPDLPLIPR